MSLGKGTNVFPYLRRHQSYSGRKFLTPEDEASLFTMDHFPLWYRQASEQPPGSFVFNLRWEEGPGNLHPCALPKSGKRGQDDGEERTTPGLLPAFPPDTAALELAWCCTECRPACSHPPHSSQAPAWSKGKRSDPKANQVTPGPHSQCQVSRIDPNRQEASVSKDPSSFKTSLKAFVAAHRAFPISTPVRLPRRQLPGHRRDSQGQPADPHRPRPLGKEER